MGLFKPAWRSSDPDKRTKWIRGKATDSPEDQIILAELATSDANIHVRWAAAAGIADLDILAQVLADIARNHDVYNHHICLALIKRVSDQRVLAQIAKSHKSDSLTDAAVEKVTDLGILNDLAKNADFWSVRRHAVGKVLRQELLADIAQNDQEAPVRQEAVKRLTIQTALEGIARNDENARVRWKAVERLTVQAALAEIATNDEDADVRQAAARQLTDQRHLADIGRNHEDVDVRLIAAEKLTDQALAQRIYAHVAGGRNGRHATGSAINKLTDKRVLKMIINGSADRYVYTWTEFVPYEVDSNYVRIMYDEVGRTVDLREAAHKRLVELNKGK